ncbi:MAG: Beta/Gamma crystallin, partial [Verrucomicrobiota bacterium]
MHLRLARLGLSLFGRHARAAGRSSVGAGAAIFAAGLTAFAQPPPPAGRALFFSEPGFRGEVVAVEAGGNLENLEFIRDARGRSFNERISSIRLEGRVRVGIFEHSQFRGAFSWLTRDVPDLTAIS